MTVTPFAAALDLGSGLGMNGMFGRSEDRVGAVEVENDGAGEGVDVGPEDKPDDGPVDEPAAGALLPAGGASVPFAVGAAIGEAESAGVGTTGADLDAEVLGYGGLGEDTPA